MSKAESQREVLGRAVERLDEACRRHTANPHDALLRDGLIQRFEFCFELGWKLVQSAALCALVRMLP